MIKAFGDKETKEFGKVDDPKNCQTKFKVLQEEN